jgi:hypothetical protein
VSRPVIRRPVALMLTLGLLLTGCGGGDDDKFSEDYKPVFGKISRLGGQLAKDLRTIGKRSDAENAKAMGDLANQTGEIQTDAEGLDAPEDVADDRDKLVAGLGELQARFRALEKEAEEGKLTAAGAQRQIGPASSKVVAAQAPLADKANVGPGNK